MNLARIAAAAALTAALAGCSLTNPIQTQVVYAASDGVRITIGETIQAENFLLLTEAEGEPGALIGALTNRGDDDTVVTVTIDGAGTHEVPVGAGESVLLTGEDVLRFDAVEAIPGANLPITISTGADGAASATVPVLDGSLPEYGEVLEGL